MEIEYTFTQGFLYQNQRQKTLILMITISLESFLAIFKMTLKRMYTEAPYTTFVVSNSTMIVIEEKKNPTSHTQENTHQNGGRFPIHSFFR